MTRTRTICVQQASRDTSCGFVQPCSPKHRHSHHSVCKENIKEVFKTILILDFCFDHSDTVRLDWIHTDHTRSIMDEDGGAGCVVVVWGGYLLTARAKRSDPQRPERPPATAGTVDVEAVGTSPLSAKQPVSSAPCSVGSSAEQSHRVRTTSC